MYFTNIKDPAINCNDLARPDSVSVVATGAGFGATQAYDLILSTSYQNGVGTSVVQTVTSWSDTSITFDIEFGSLDESDSLYLCVANGDAFLPSRKLAVSQPDIHCASGTFNAPTTTGSTSVVTGLSFTPKAIYLWTSAGTGTSQVSGQGVGFSASTSGRYHGAGRADAASYATKGRRAAGSNYGYIYNNTSRLGTVTATSDGFSINFTTTDTESRIIHWIAFGGRTMLWWNYATAVSSGSLPFGAAKFTPDLVLVSTTANTFTLSTDGPMFAFGAIAKDISDDLKQWCVGWSAFSPDGSSSHVHSKLATDAFSEQIYNNAETWSASATSLGYSDISWSGSDSDSFTHFALFLDGAEIDIGTVTKAASASTTSIGSIDDPDLMIVVTGGDVKDVIVGHVNMAVGVADASGQSHARTWADLIGSLTEGTQASDTSRAIGHYDSSGSVIDVGSLSLTGTPTITWDTPRAGTAEIAYLALKLPAAASDQTVTPDSTVAASVANSTTASASGDASASPAATSPQSIANSATAVGTGSADASPSSTPASAIANDATASATGSATIEPASNEAASIAIASTATASGTATAEPQSPAASSIANSSTATATGDANATPASNSPASIANSSTSTATGDASATPSSPDPAATSNASTANATGNAAATPESCNSAAIANTSTATAYGDAAVTPEGCAPAASANSATATGEGNEVTPESPPAGAIANPATLIATGNSSVTPSGTEASSLAHTTTAAASGNASASPSANTAGAIASATTATSTGSSELTPSSSAPAALANASTANATGTADITPASSAPATVANAASATGTGTVDITPEPTLPASIANEASIDSGAQVYPESNSPRARAFTATAISPAANPNTPAPGSFPSFAITSTSAKFEITSRTSTFSIDSRTATMTIPPAYQPRIGDTAKPLICTLSDLPADIDNTTVRLLFKLPKSGVEQIRNATTFDVATGVATYEWETEDFPPGTKAGTVSVRWDYRTTSGKPGTTNSESFSIVA